VLNKAARPAGQGASALTQELVQALGAEEAVTEKCLNPLRPNKLVRTSQRAELLPERREAFLRLGARLDELVPAAATAHLVIGGA